MSSTLTVQSGSRDLCEGLEGLDHAFGCYVYSSQAQNAALIYECIVMGIDSYKLQLSVHDRA